MASTPQASISPQRLTARVWAMMIVAAIEAAAMLPTAARATPYISVTPDQPLRFGSVIAAQSGARIVSASGDVTNINLFPVGTRSAGPAQFTITYHRDPGPNPPIKLVTQIILSSGPSFSQGSLSGQLSSFDTDLPGNPTLRAGQAQTITWPLCTTTDCTLTFHVGGRLEINGATGGGPIAVTLSMTAHVVTVL